jgi:hypothetical protein
VKGALALALLLGVSSPALSQQPFYTDDADVTEAGRIHVESFNEFDWLPASQSPHLRQNTLNMKINYGLGHGLELDLDAPLITIVNDATAASRQPFGLGDTNFGIKYKVREERAGSAAPAFALVSYIEVPTGDAATGLGSGLVDTWLYAVFQKTLPREVVLRGNAGYLFTGNTSTGVVGITTARGQVATFGGSIVRNVSRAVAVGVELTAAATNDAQLNRTQLQGMLGGNYTFREGLTLDLGVIVGRFAASPRIGALIGFSWDLPH